MVRKRVSQDNPLVKVSGSRVQWHCPICGSAHQGRVQGGHSGDCCIPCYFGTSPVKSTAVDTREKVPMRNVLIVEYPSLPAVTEGHNSGCVCELCYPKRVKTDLKFSTGRR